ncbi:hypothetical protein JCM33374_g2048 [Metschnikowia sp. JCM 33374]|nr:hypothetical protein JCM33374_g2048 [Metschnikowia sp. JCM 33374]
MIQTFVILSLMLSLLAGKFISSKYTLAENPPITHKVYFDIEQDGGSLGRVTIGLFGTIMPNTVDNFRKFATADDSSYGYKGSIFHKAIPDFMIQGGDGEYGNKSMYGDRLTSSNTLKHDRKYRVSVATAVKTIEGSQFSITTGVVPWFSSVTSCLVRLWMDLKLSTRSGRQRATLVSSHLRKSRSSLAASCQWRPPRRSL